MVTERKLYNDWVEKCRDVDVKFRTDGILGPEESAQRIIAHVMGKKKVRKHITYSHGIGLKLSTIASFIRVTPNVGDIAF